MSSGTNYNAFCADYRTMANCLFAIQAAEAGGDLAAHPELTGQLYVFDWGVLRKLYNTTAGILGRLEGFTLGENYLYFDFDLGNFNNDFNLGVVVDPAPGYGQDIISYTPGDYTDFDFTGLDFNTGLVDDTNTGYSSHFQTILNMFGLLCSRSSELTDAERQRLNQDLAAVLSAFALLQNALSAAGLNPCVPQVAHFKNSSFLYLQAAGSDGGNGIAAGVHLRWSLAGDLGLNHLPQGGYLNAPAAGYNRPDDYITLSRTPYANPALATLDFGLALPAIDFAARQWRYTVNSVFGGRSSSSAVTLTFTDAVLYSQAAAAVSPQAGALAFLQAYRGMIELVVADKACFAFGYDFRPVEGRTDGFLKIEALSAAELGGTGTETVNIRQTVTAGSGPVTGVLQGDNLTRLRLQQSAGGWLQSISFETYDDFIGTRLAADWTVVGNAFALSLADQEVFDRLETAAYPVDGLWPQYNDGTRVRVANYQDKWGVSRANDPSVKATVQKYLELSATDPRAVAIIRDDGAGPDDPGLSFSYLDALNLMATDFHIARMLGLGCIDAAALPGSGQYIYKISYTNLLAPGSPAVTVHEYASMPTGTADSRLPEKPAIRPLTYAVAGADTAGGMIDAQGYISNLNTRLVNIGRLPYNFETLPASFFTSGATALDFNIFRDSRSILYGIEYRPAGQGSYVKPEIPGIKMPGYIYYAYDADFQAAGVAETVLCPDDADSLYVHFEQQEGVHYYAVYGVNWFSRASVRSEEAATDATVFPIPNSLRPPADVAAQYIQEEDTLLFTTGTEQAWLAGRAAAFPGQDVSFTRVTFNWLDLADISYVKDPEGFDYASVLKPTRVKPWFRALPPLQVTGLITSVIPVTGNEELLALYTGSYTTLDGTLADPAIAGEDFSRFTGSLLVTPEGQFPVQAVAAGAGGPVITVSRLSTAELVEDAGDPGMYGTRKSYILPLAGSRFTVTENLSDEANWSPVAGDVQLVNFTNPAAPVTETFVDDEGNITRYLVGGISGNALVSEVHAAADGAVMPGYFAVSFDAGINLAPHPQSGLPFDPASPGAHAPGALHPPVADWYNGLVRLPVDGSPAAKKLLQVIRITGTAPVQLIVYDGSYQEDSVQLSASATDFVEAVNFHPGFKVYLFPEPPPDYFLNGANIQPGPAATDKKTLLGLQATDTGAGGTGYVSDVSLPVLLLARRIVEPVRPDMPLFAGLRVRPDAINKAAFTLDLKIGPDAATGAARSPFGVAFYRTTNEDILNALYNPDTVAAILAALDALTADEGFDQRYGELANLFFDPDNPGHFRVFDATPAPYGFPVPDKTGLTAPEDDLATRIAKYHDALMLTLLPLTAQVPVLAYLKNGRQTDKREPVIRDADGGLLTPADPRFDPFPMIRKYTSTAEANTTYVRFTDYTLSGSSRYLYFYGGAEVTNQLVTGELSPFAGPVTIVHTLPPDAPTVRFFSLGPPAVESSSPIAVSFSLLPFLPGDTITRARIYRSLNQQDTLSLQSMPSRVDFDIVSDDQYGIVITDTFSDYAVLPAGELLYYRLAFVRSVINEDNLPEDITGYGSEVVTINLIDTVNPQAPVLTYLQSENKLTWMPTANKGTYYLYTQNSRGNWQQLYQVKPVSQTDAMAYVLPNPLVPTDENGNRIYYRFKVKAENSSGLLNLVDNELTI
ncbi:hypothetical protein KXD93_22495 [Mucilaginibacter sp. BJC16-A38]|uniref:hypothetical protein n=1 Tax=Mucilaginibacter phenanthrenivorans TaxID=1234842 RepID=UPI00215763E1|nr:hypothetical protein [Mucilaginibacter phenanthrenivorans]MCR8560441.1 hypothetical protein [Mucilaginibacter phenanthrenivorans]